MSRLPRLHSSPDRGVVASGSMAPSLKRKVAYDEEYESSDQPRKLPAIGSLKPNAPLRPSRTAMNLSSSQSYGKVAPALTNPQGPALTTSRSRSTSAPPKSVGAARVAVRPGRTNAGRVVSGGPLRPAAAADERFQALQEQVSSIESARAADAARLAADMEAERAKVAELQTNHQALSKELAVTRTQEINQRRELLTAVDELQALKKKYSQEVDDLEIDVRKKDRELRETKEDLREARTDLERERESASQLKATISQQSTAHLALTTQNNVLQAQLNALQSNFNVSCSSVSQLQLDLETSKQRIAELENEVREAEVIRRRLHNMVQELKGNIRVFCRVRPILPSDAPANLGCSNSSSSSSISSLSSINSQSQEDFGKVNHEMMASITFPDKRDHKEIALMSSSESAMGQERTESWSFAFDRVFEPHSTQADVFEDISQLAQSCADGYNVCIFAYGQTGSGKSFTMEGGTSEDTSGMIPRAVNQLFAVTEELKPKGWEYKMEGQFLEIYNETINDLLGKGEFDKKKHEIKHEKGGTRVTDVVVVPLESPSQVRSLLSIAQSRRTVAATLMNERSSRSHSVFTLRISGQNSSSGETCEGSLNLVDLAGSERLNSSGAANDKERLKETQNINKSLSALGDVIAALGEKGDGKSDKHIPYRNSKLTYLLQNSLSGNSKTLMILNLSPLATHLGESLCSLRFATKVNNTTIGTAKRHLKSISQ